MKRSRRRNRNTVKTDKVADTFLQNIREQVRSAEVQTAVAFIKHKDGSIYYVTTEADNDALIGLVEIGKNGLLND